jgi:hypothetical protein
MRLSEAKAMVESLQLANVAQEHVSTENAATIADSLITTLQGILAGDGGPRLADLVTQEMVRRINECLQSAGMSFPKAESFQTPGATRYDVRSRGGFLVVSLLTDQGRNARSRGHPRQPRPRPRDCARAPDNEPQGKFVREWLVQGTLRPVSAKYGTW